MSCCQPQTKTDKVRHIFPREFKEKYQTSELFGECMLKSKMRKKAPRQCLWMRLLQTTTAAAWPSDQKWDERMFAGMTRFLVRQLWQGFFRNVILLLLLVVLLLKQILILIGTQIKGCLREWQIFLQKAPQQNLGWQLWQRFIFSRYDKRILLEELCPGKTVSSVSNIVEIPIKPPFLPFRFKFFQYCFNDLNPL